MLIPLLKNTWETKNYVSLFPHYFYIIEYFFSGLITYSFQSNITKENKMQKVSKYFNGFPLDIQKIIIDSEEPKEGQEERYWGQKMPHVMVIKEVSKSREYSCIYQKALVNHSYLHSWFLSLDSGGLMLLDWCLLA